MSAQQKTWCPEGTDITKNSHKYMWLKRFLKAGGAPPMDITTLNLEGLRDYGVLNGYMTVEEMQEPEGLHDPVISNATAAQEAQNDRDSTCRARQKKLDDMTAQGVDLDCFTLNCDEIVPNLFLGGEDAASDSAILLQHGITHILVPAMTGHPHTPPPFTRGSLHIQNLASYGCSWVPYFIRISCLRHCHRAG